LLLQLALLLLLLLSHQRVCAGSASTCSKNVAENKIIEGACKLLMTVFSYTLLHGTRVQHG
jgi:hypothetical protein